MKGLLWIGISLALAAACGGSPDVRVDDGTGAGKGGTTGNGQGGSSAASSGNGGRSIVAGSGQMPMCEPATCEDLGMNCGRAPDGCGEVIECGDCDDDGICGLNEPNVCSTQDDIDEFCEPVSEEDACDGKECGVEGDGCGDTYDCGDCADDEACGIEEPFQCSPDPTGDPDDCPAEIESCEEVGAECGFVGNGCGAVIDCAEELGQDCADDETCIDGECVGGNVNCDPIDEAAACNGKECGMVGDGCGDVIDCGACATGEMCGFQAAYQCDVVACQPRTAAEACVGKDCGIVYDGCGTAPANTFDCSQVNGGCDPGEFCGIETPFQCDTPDVPSCTPTATTCAGLGWACGQAVDNCGNVYNCAAEGRTCGPLETCVGGITGPATCMGSGGGSCPLCSSVPTCTGGTLTRLTGRVITPGQTDGNTANQVGVPNAFVYILRTNVLTDLPAISSGIPTGGESCDRCDEQNLGSVLAGAVTDATGAFTIEGNVPVGVEFILVTKVGKFRRATRMTLGSGAACTTTALATAAATNPTRLPRTMSDGIGVNIPRVAITTGEIDAMECVFWKMGLQTSEFVNGSATTTGARLHMYRGGRTSTTQGGASIDANTPYDATLYSSLARMQSYDMVVADCEGGSWDANFPQGIANGPNVREYVNRGGRLFASHLSFSWLHNNGTTAYAPGTPYATGLAPAATWTTSANTGPNSGTGTISVGRTNASPRIDNFAAWMVRESVTTAPNYNFTIADPRSQVNGAQIGPVSEEFVYCAAGQCGSSTPIRTQQFSFNTPYAAPAAAACGRVAYSGFHVAAGGAAVGANASFPGLCQGASANNGNLTNQEKVLLYMLFDLGACIGDEPDPPGCTPQACPAYPACGTQPNGCGGTQQCGCPSGEACINGRCEEQGCVPTTCELEGVTCANISDGCGEVLECDCPGCDRQTCEEVGAECGMIGDGCGGADDCGPCPDGQVCTNVGGDPNQCFGCDPDSCGDVGAECGMIGDGCGGTVDCGPCPPGQICGAQAPNECGDGGGCDPLSCGDLDAECGVIGDGCGGTVDCGPCPPGEVCGINQPYRCDPPPPCEPVTCEELEAEDDDDYCGLVSDRCGDVLDCGECEPGFTCGIYKPNVCDVIR